MKKLVKLRDVPRIRKKMSHITVVLNGRWEANMGWLIHTAWVVLLRTGIPSGHAGGWFADCLVERITIWRFSRRETVQVPAFQDWVGVHQGLDIIATAKPGVVGIGRWVVVSERNWKLKKEVQKLTEMKTVHRNIKRKSSVGQGFYCGWCKIHRSAAGENRVSTAAVQMKSTMGRTAEGWR